jgi:Dolichyl-phosphate-mannose-protein mannosyltransferase
MVSRADARNPVICGLVVVAAFLLVGPFVEMPFNDDWSYAFTVQQLLHTGHLHYNGWSAPTLISQVYWAALLAKLFGFSFTVLRFSTLPFAIGSVILCYLFARRARLIPSQALFAALLLGLSPLFLPLATSFMTDVPALCWILLALYAAARAVERSTFAWMSVAVLAILIGGSARQSVWLAAPVALIYIAWAKRSHRSIVIAAAFALATVVLVAVFILRWFHGQPDIMAESSVAQFIISSAAKPAVTARALLQLYQTTTLLILPAALLIAPTILKKILPSRRMRIAALLAVALIAIAVISNPPAWIEPYCGNTLDATGVLGSFELSGPRPGALPLAVSQILSIAVIFVTVIFLTGFLTWIARPAAAARHVQAFFNPDQNPPAASLLILFGAIYLVAVLIRAGEAPMIDRYVLPLIPVAAITLLLVARSTPKFAWALLALYGLYAVASTQDVLALGRARVAAVHRLEAASVKPTEIAAGLEYDMWTQLQAQGRINDPRTANPAFPYDPTEGIAPALNCLYRVEFHPGADTAPTNFGSIDYISWLPPFRRRIFIDQFVNPHWVQDQMKPRWFEQRPQ